MASRHGTSGRGLCCLVELIVSLRQQHCLMLLSDWWEPELWRDEPWVAHSSYQMSVNVHICITFSIHVYLTLPSQYFHTGLCL